ncbi:MAG: DEAD/DEAH box helicase [Cyclobacteriaceae bacterium]
MSKNIERFNEFKLNRQLLSAIEDLDYQKPTPIQVQAIPLILAGHDLLGIAQTGTGKTAAYLLPILMKIKYAQGDEPRVMILVPTRELVIQVDANAKQLASYLDLRIVQLYGGVGPKTQIEALKQGADIVVSTPGRFLELYRKGDLSTKGVQIMVLDEADKMMDMGFMPQIREILEKIPTKRQNLLFSATFPVKVEKLSGEFLDFPLRVEVTPQSTPADTITQYYYQVPNFRTKVNMLNYLFQNPDFRKVIVFVRTKETANNIFKFLSRKVESQTRIIHSNKAQNTRLNAMRDFKDGDIRILVTTDVSARGHDINMVSHVINFELPLAYEDYVHRIGRTGRAEKTGIAISFVNASEILHLHKIEKLIRGTIEELPIPAEVEVVPTGRDERIEIERDIDNLKKALDPSFKGAFHEKKERVLKKKPEKKSGSKKPRGRKR